MFQIQYYLVFTLFSLLNNKFIQSIEQQQQNNNNNNKRIINDNNEIKPIINSKFNSSCPNEYKLCKCDYETTNLNSFLIKINCQHESHHHHQNHNSIDMSVTKKQQLQNEKLSLLLKINVSNYPHINSINQLELSRTLIKEIPMDAFQVKKMISSLS
jgi:hypothetical protein